MIRLTRFLWVWFQCVCPLMSSCNTYHLTWVCLTLGVRYLLTAAPQSTAAAPFLGWGVSPPTALPDLQHGMVPLGPPAPAQPPLPGRGVALPSRRPWPWTHGISSQPPPWPQTRGELPTWNCKWSLGRQLLPGKKEEMSDPPAEIITQVWSKLYHVS